METVNRRGLINVAETDWNKLNAVYLTARDLIDGPPGPHVNKDEAEAWDEAMRVKLAEQLALIPRKPRK